MVAGALFAVHVLDEGWVKGEWLPESLQPFVDVKSPFGREIYGRTLRDFIEAQSVRRLSYVEAAVEGAATPAAKGHLPSYYWYRNANERLVNVYRGFQVAPPSSGEGASLWVPREITYKARVTASLFHEHFQMRREPVVFREGKRELEENLALLNRWDLAAWGDVDLLRAEAGDCKTSVVWLRTHGDSDISVVTPHDGVPFMDIVRDTIGRKAPAADDEDAHIAMINPLAFYAIQPMDSFWENETLLVPPMSRLSSHMHIPTFATRRQVPSVSYILGRGSDTAKINEKGWTQLRTDPMDGLYVVTTGVLCVRMWSPGDALRLSSELRFIDESGVNYANNSRSFYTALNIYAPQEEFRKRFRGHRPSGRVCVSAGDLLYVPAGWWHTWTARERLSALVFWITPPAKGPFCAGPKCNNKSVRNLDPRDDEDDD